MKPLNKNLLSFKEPDYFGDRELYKPNYNFLKAGVGVGLIGACLVTPATNWMIVLIVPVYIGQRPFNYSKINSRLTKFKIKFRGVVR